MNNILEEKLEAKEMKKKRDILKKEFKPKYETVFDGVKRCKVCGLAIAKGEEGYHEVFHSTFISCKLQYDKDILTYEEIREVEKKLKNVLELTINNDSCSRSIYSNISLDLIYLLEYNYSQRFWNYSRPHPTLDEYKYLLWNTKEFITKLKKYMPENFILQEQNKYISNRKLKSSKDLFMDSFVFIDVEESKFPEGKDLSLLDTLIEKNKSNEEEFEEEFEGEIEEIHFNIEDFTKLLLNKKAV